MSIAQSFIHPTVSALPRGLPLLRPRPAESHCGCRGHVRISRAETVTNVEFSLTSRAPICRTTGLSIS